MNQPRQVKLLPVEFRLAQADKRDITLSVSEFTTSSKSASDSLVTSADCWIEGHWVRVSNSEQNPSSSSFTFGCGSASGWNAWLSPKRGGWIGWGNKNLNSFSKDCLCSVMMIINNAMHKSVCYVMQSRMIKYRFMHTQIYPGSVTQTYIQSPGYTWDFQSTILV